MNSHTTSRFRSLLAALPASVQQQAREAYKRFAADPSQPSLRFKHVHPAEPIYSVRISRDYRALGVLHGDDIVWFWIGSHADYERLLSQF